MKINELLLDASNQGFKTVSDGSDIWNLNNFLEDMLSDKHDYTMHDNGNIYRCNIKGNEEIIHRFFLLK